MRRASRIAGPLLVVIMAAIGRPALAQVDVGRVVGQMVRHVAGGGARQFVDRLLRSAGAPGVRVGSEAQDEVRRSNERLAQELEEVATPVFAKTETITGRFVDLACYTKDHANVANAHKGMSETCAQDCAKKGRPPALVTDDGKVYQITGDLTANNNAKIVPHMSHKMQLTGDVTEKDGTMMIVATDMKMLGK
jgi:histone H3/H4